MHKNQHEKLLHSIVYFIEHTNHCYKLKLFKLLYFLDFEHYRLTGRPVTGLEYFAWKMGPVPQQLFEEFKKPGEEFKKSIAILPSRDKDYDFEDNKLILKAKISFNKKLFSKREQELLEKTAEIFKEALSTKMTEASHLPNLPWDRVYNKEKRTQKLIPYEYAIDKDKVDSISKEEAELRNKEREEVWSNFKWR